MSEFLRRVKFLLRRGKLERQLQSEMAFHREMMGDDAPRFGNALALREEAREVWGWSWLDRLWQDLRFAVRLFRKSPLVALTAIAVLAIGIGVNLTAFALFNQVALAPMPGRESMYRFLRHNEQSVSSDVPYAAVEFYRDHSRSFSAVLAHKDERLAYGAENAQAGVQFVSGNFFRELGVSSAYGRTIEAADDKSTAPAVVVLSYGFWRRQFGGDTRVIGQTIRINRKPATIVGVAPYDLIGLEAEPVDMWAPIRQEPYFVNGSDLLTRFTADGVAMFGRLKPGISPLAAEAELQPLVSELARQHPDDFWKNEGLRARSAAHLAHLDTSDIPVVAAFAMLVLLVLAISCGNLGNLLLAHAVSREREISIRFAVGATRGRVFRQLLSESLALAACGALGGLLLSNLGMRALIIFLQMPLPVRAWPDWRMIAAATMLGAFATVFFGIAPAVSAARQAHRRSRARTIFIAAQVTASCVLLIVSGLLVRAMRHAVTSDPGFEYKHLLTVDPKLYAHGYDGARSELYLRDLAERLRSLPGVKAVGMAVVAPMGNRVRIYNYTKPRPARFYGNAVDENFLPTLGVAIVRGRNIRPKERGVVVIGEGLARQFWPGEDALGKSLKEMVKNEGDYTVVGIAAAARSVAPRDSLAMEAYLPIGSAEMPEGVLTVRSAGDPAGLVPAIQEIAAGMNSAFAPDVTLLSTAFRERLADARQITVVVSAVGALALLLAVVGLYGVVSYNVSQRTREFGIRMALGASPRQVARAVAAQFVRPVGIALALGLALAAGASVALRSQLYGLSNFDPVAYMAAALLLLGVGAVAAAGPTSRATHIDPTEALRHE